MYGALAQPPRATLAPPVVPGGMPQTQVAPVPGNGDGGAAGTGGAEAARGAGGATRTAGSAGPPDRACVCGAHAFSRAGENTTSESGTSMEGATRTSAAGAYGDARDSPDDRVAERAGASARGAASNGESTPSTSGNVRGAFPGTRGVIGTGDESGGAPGAKGPEERQCEAWACCLSGVLPCPPTMPLSRSDSGVFPLPLAAHASGTFLDPPVESFVACALRAFFDLPVEPLVACASRVFFDTPVEPLVACASGVFLDPPVKSLVACASGAFLAPFAPCASRVFYDQPLEPLVA